MATQDEYIKTALRLPRHLHADIAVSAERAGRSMNAEIIERLSKSSDLGHLHRVIDQLTQVMEGDRKDTQLRLGLVRTLFEQTIDALEAATWKTLQQSASDADIQQFRDEISRARSVLQVLAPQSSFSIDVHRKPLPGQP
ncbi:Arc family DNA-binding protein [Burkholderia cenocepacia]|uniref:Arc family DNA-binding protein n=1 Tax=Burkholderia cenocepacia TaxID=95486 RepID=UPI0022384EE2|nr:Arc family DNA-binding protein [Burkholderia cenocepacia]MCW5137576.1 Arc family DNA-binding protein [Burkholderia cenocepacia]